MPRAKTRPQTKLPFHLQYVRVALTPHYWVKLKVIQLDRSKCDYPVIYVNWYHLSSYSLFLSLSACSGMDNFSPFLCDRNG